MRGFDPRSSTRRHGIRHIKLYTKDQAALILAYEKS